MAGQPFTEPLGTLEAKVMTVVWRRHAVTARDVWRELQGKRERAYTTIMTTLDRLHKKGLLRREKEGLAWRYTAALSRAEHERLRADTLAVQMLREHGEAGLAAFVDAASVDGKLLDELASLVAEKRGHGKKAR